MSGRKDDGLRPSSSAVGEEASFDDFKLQVLQLCQDIGIGLPSKVEDLPSDPSHRVIGLKFTAKAHPECILRITTPSLDMDRARGILDQISILEHFAKHPQLKAPQVLAYDTTTQNVLNTQYVILTRLTGTVLEQVYYTLSVDERLEVAAQVAKLILHFEDMKFARPGQFVGPQDSPPTATTVSPHAYGKPTLTGFRSSPDEHLPSLPENLPLLELFLTLAEGRLGSNRDWPSFDSYCYKMMEIARQMHVAGLMRTYDTENVLCFWNLDAKNILIKSTPIGDDVRGKQADPLDCLELRQELPVSKKRSAWSVTGVIGWDEVKIVPKVLTRSPPTYLWFKDGLQGARILGNDETVPPSNFTEGVLIKAHFDHVMSAASPTYLEDAYHRGHWLRTLAKFAICGFTRSADYDDFDNFVKGWKVYFNSTGLQYNEVASTTDSDHGSENTEEFYQSYDEDHDKFVQICKMLGIGVPLKHERLSGTGSQQVLEISFGATSCPSKCVARLPFLGLDDMFHPYQHRDQIAVQQFFAHSGHFPAASILAYDSSLDNPLDRQIVFQTQRNGTVLGEVYYTLSLQERLDIVTNFAQLVQKLAHVQFDRPGRLIGGRDLPIRSSKPPRPPTELSITGFKTDDYHTMDSVCEQPLLDLMLTLLKRQRKKAWKHAHVLRYIQLKQVAQEMEVAGLFRAYDNQNVLDFWELNPQNIIIAPQSPSTSQQDAGRNTIVDGNTAGSWRITEFVDWDNVRSLPKVLTRAPPAWLWFNPDDRDNEWLKDDNDASPLRDLFTEELLVKEHFDQLMSTSDPSYTEDTYFRGRWLRELFRYAVNDFRDESLWQRFETFETIWRAYFQSTGLPKPTAVEAEFLDARSRDSGTKNTVRDAQIDRPKQSEWCSFESFHVKVLELCRHLPYGDPVKVSDMRSRPSNLHVGLNFKTENLSSCFLRVSEPSRTDEFEVSDQVAILRYLAHQQEIPTASVISYDSTSKNALGQHYVLQKQLPGHSLDKVYHKLSLRERLEITTQVAELLIKLESVHFNRPGRLTSVRDSASHATDAVLNAGIDIGGFRLDSFTDMPTRDGGLLDALLVAMLREQKLHSPHDQLEQRARYDRFMDIVEEIDTAGLMRLGDHQNVLWHGDLTPRHIMVQRTVGTIVPSTKDEAPRWVITGVLDWDKVASVPRVLTRTPPSWLWLNDDGRLYWLGGRYRPVPYQMGPEELTIKAHFDQIMSTACPSYLEDAYHRGWWLRRIFTFALEGFTHGNNWEESGRFEKDWDEYFASTGLSML